MTNKNLNPFFSIVIPTLNEEIYLPLLLKDLSLQNLTDFEVVHVDGGSKDKTLEKAKQWENKLSLQTISHTIKNVSAQRNRGGSEAGGEWIIFMDADDRLPNSFLSDVKKQIDLAENNSQKRFDVFTTLIKFQDRPVLKNRITINFINFFLRNTAKTRKPISMGAMIGIRQEIFKKLRFNEKSKVSEDSIFVRDCIRSGWKYVVLTSPTYAYSMRRMESKGSVRTALKGLVMNLRYLAGDDFSEHNYGYEMLGGGAYDKDKEIK